MKKRILLVALLALAIILVFAVTASAKKPAAPHFVTHASGTFDSTGDPYDPFEGVWYYDGTSLVQVAGYIDVTIDIESVGEADGPYDDGSDPGFVPKWDYQTKGFITAEAYVTDPYGNKIHKRLRAKVESVTICEGYLRTFYFFDCKYKGEIYSGYVGQTGPHLYMPALGQLLGGWNNYGIVRASGGGDFSYELNDPAVDPGP